MSRKKSSVAEYRSYYLPYEFPVVLLSGEYWKISDVPGRNLHFHNCLEIGVCHSESGYMKFIGMEEPLLFREGDVTCIPRNIPHTTCSSPGTESHWSYLFLDAAELFRSAAPGFSREMHLFPANFKNYRYILSRDQYPKVYGLAMAAIRELEEKRPHYRTSATGLLLALTIEIYRVQSEGGENSGRALTNRPPENAMVISPALDYIEDYYAQEFSIDCLADICHLSPTHFRRLFRAIIGTSPLDFVNSMRIYKACNLLRSTEDSILEISERVGFRSVSSFNRHFMDVMQVTPRAYRNETLQGQEDQKKMSILEYKGWMYPEK